MQCLFCKKTIPLLRRLKDSEFCSEDHRKQYVKEQSLLALESLVSGGVRSATRARGKTLAEVSSGALSVGSGNARTGTLLNRRNSAGDQDRLEYEAQQDSAYSAALEAAHNMATGNDEKKGQFQEIEECPTDDLLFDALSNITTDYEPLLPPGDLGRSAHSTQMHEAVEQASGAGHRGELSPVAAPQSNHWSFPASIPPRRAALMLRRKRAELVKLLVSGRAGEKDQTRGKRAAVPLNWPRSSGPAMRRLALAIEGKLTAARLDIPPMAEELAISFEPIFHACSLEPVGQTDCESLSAPFAPAHPALMLARHSGLALAGAFEGGVIELRSLSGKADTAPSDWLPPILKAEIRQNVPRLTLKGNFLGELAIGESFKDPLIQPRFVAGSLRWIGDTQPHAAAVQASLNPSDWLPPILKAEIRQNVPRLKLKGNFLGELAIGESFKDPLIYPRFVAGSLGWMADIQPHAAAVKAALNRLTLPSVPRPGFALQQEREAAVIVRSKRPAVSEAATFEREPFSTAQSIYPLRHFSDPLTLSLSERVPMELLLIQRTPESMQFAVGAEIAWTKFEPRLARTRLKFEGHVEAPPPPMASSSSGAIKPRAVNVVELTALAPLDLKPNPVFCASSVTADFFAAPAVWDVAFRSSPRAKSPIAGLEAESYAWPRLGALVGAQRLNPESPTAVLPAVETGRELSPPAAINPGTATLNHASLEYVPFPHVPAIAVSARLSDSEAIWYVEGQTATSDAHSESAAPPMAPASPLRFLIEAHNAGFPLAGFEPGCALGAIEVALLPEGISTAFYNAGLIPPQSTQLGALSPAAASGPPVSVEELANLIENLRQASLLPAMLAAGRPVAPVRGWKDALAQADQAASVLAATEIPATLAAAAAACGAVSWRASVPVSTCHSLPVTDTITVLETMPATKTFDSPRLEVASRPTGHGRRLRNAEAIPAPPPPAAAPEVEDLLRQIPAPPTVEPAKTVAPVENTAENTAEKNVENVVPPMAGLVAFSSNKLKKTKVKMNQSLGPLQLLIQPAQIQSGLKLAFHEPAARRENALRKQVQDNKPASGFFLFWRKAPADLKWITLSLPVVLVVWMMTSGRSHPKPANPAPVETSASVGTGETETAVLPLKDGKGQKAAGETKEARVKGTAAPAPLAPSPDKVEEGSWSKFMQRVSYRSAIAHEEDFRSGLSQWEGRGGWASTWNYDRNGLLRAGQLALFSPSLDMTDYHLEVTGSLDRRSFGWVFRAADMNNYYGGRLVETRPGPMPTVTLERFIVAGGKKIKSQFFPVPLSMRGESIFTVVVEVAGNSFTTSVQGQIVDSFNDDRLTNGGVGLFALKGEESRIFRISLTHNNDLFGRLCAMIASRETISPGGRAK